MYFWELVKKVVRQVEDLSFFYFFYFFYKKVKKSIKKYFQLFLMLWMGDDANHVALLGFKGPFNSTISFQGFSLSLSQGNTLSLQKLCPSRWLMQLLVASLLAASWAHAHAWISPLQVAATF